MSGQIVDANLNCAPKQRDTEEEKNAIKEGRIFDGVKGQAGQTPAKEPRRAPFAVCEQSTVDQGLDG